jgi:hypothetical protein
MDPLAVHVKIEFTNKKAGPPIWLPGSILYPPATQPPFIKACWLSAPASQQVWLFVDLFVLDTD